MPEDTNPEDYQTGPPPPPGYEEERVAPNSDLGAEDEDLGAEVKKDRPEDKRPPRLEDVIVKPPLQAGEDNPAKALIELPHEQDTWPLRLNIDEAERSAYMEAYVVDQSLGDDGIEWGKFLHYAGAMGVSVGGRGRDDYLDAVDKNTPDHLSNFPSAGRVADAKNAPQ